MQPLSRFVRFGAALALSALVATLASRPAPGQGGRAPLAFPASIRDRIHFTAAKVPAFPMDDRRLLRAKDWPDSMTIGGKRAVRRIFAWQSNEGRALRSLNELKSGMRYMLFYDHTGSSNVGWGPRYTWNSNKQLIQRIWYEPDDERLVTHDYTYYRNGRLLGYSVRSEKRNQVRLRDDSFEFLSEFFDPEGNLIGIGYEKMRTDANDFFYAWKGTPVPFDEFRMRAHVLYSSAHPGHR
jgi:hypothetical protein